MPIGLVSDNEFERELARLTPKESHSIQPKVEILEKESHGRNEGDVNVPEALRKIIGEESVINGRAAALSLANAFGISPSSVSAYAKGATSTTSYNEPKRGILDHINKSRHRAIKRASHTMNRALDAITQDKLDYTDAKDLSSIAKDMSVVIKNLEPPQPVNASSDVNASSPQYVIFAPQFRDERTFESIVVNE